MNLQSLVVVGGSRQIVQSLHLRFCRVINFSRSEKEYYIDLSSEDTWDNLKAIMRVHNNFLIYAGILEPKRILDYERK